MGNPSKLIPVKCNLDLAAEYMDNLTARFIKNLTPYIGATDEYAGIKEGQNTLKQKKVQSNELYVNIPIPAGENFCVGAAGFATTKEVYVMVWNSANNHFIYRLNCSTRTFDIVKIDPCFNFQKKPEYFMGETQISLTIIPLVEPDSGKEVWAKELKWTDGFNYQGYLRVDDCIASNGFDATLYPYFAGTYDKCAVLRMGVPTPKDCITVTEIPRVTDPLDPNYDVPLNNPLLFQKWFFIIKHIDVWGRPSEWGARSIEYTPGINDCIANSNNIPRCLNLEFDAGSPFINNIEIAWLSCSQGTSTVWHKEETLFLYTGSNIGEWWKRSRNPNITYNSSTNKITYKFCRSKECEIVPTDETDRLENPLPKRSQALINLNQNTALFNNKSKFNPFSQTLKDKFKATVIAPTPQNSDLRNITIYVAIYNEGNDLGPRWSGVSKDGNNGYVYGGFPQNTFDPNFARAYYQSFKNTAQSGFTGYLVGGGSVTSTQVYVDALGALIDDPQHTTLINNPNIFTLQKFEFNSVAKGEYIFRLASQLSDPNVDANYRQTSTTVWGLCPFTKPSNFNIDVFGRVIYSTQELYVDVCNGDYNTLNDNKMLVISDMASKNAHIDLSWRATQGYWNESRLNGYAENPIELMNVIGANGFTSLITDHNGFYYYSTRGNGRTFAFDFAYKCNFAQYREGQGGAFMRIIDYYMDEISSALYRDYLTTPCNRVLIKGKLTLSNTNIGISNATVTLTRGGYAVTDENGEFTIIAHDYIYNEYLIGGVRSDKLIISSGCGYTGVNGSCITVTDITIVKCNTCTDRIITIADVLLEYTTEKSLLSGGTYGWGVVGWDWLGRATFVQALGYLSIPTINQSKAISPSQIQINIDPTATFPKEIEYLTFFITPETTIDKYLDWIVDDVDFIDSQGLVNNISPTQIKIYYGSIIQYSKLHNFNTTTAWQFIPEGNNTPALNDKVQFFLNGDGKYFDKAISGLVKYQQTGEYFTIDYVSSLKDLKKNALIRLVRPKDCTGDEPYYEICGSRVDIVALKAQRNQFILDAFDTYYLNRQIPVPAPQTPTTESITTTVTNGNTSVATQQIPVPTPTILELRTFGYKFEHFAPSNFWGNGCSHIGRINYKNPYEAELIQLYQVALSGALSVNGQLNYLCYFDEAKKTSFEVPNAGGIVAAYAEIGKLFLIGQTDSFLVGYNDNLGRVNANGTFQAPSTPNEFGKPQRKEGDTYGCHPADKMTIRYRNGIICWVDRSRAEAVKYDWNLIKTFTKDKCDGWFKAKCKEVMTDENKYFTGGINPATGEYIITNQTIDNTTYINTERDYNALVPETFSFDIENGDLKSWFSYLPENFAFLDGDILNVQMFSFKNGLPYSHYNGKTNTSYNTFYGTPCEPVLRFVFTGEDAFAKKMFLTASLYCENQLFFADKIITEAKQESRLLLSQWNKAAYFSYATFLCNLKSIADPNLPLQTGVNKLFDGDKLYGNWIDVRLIGDPKDTTKYAEILGIVISSFKYG